MLKEVMETTRRPQELAKIKVGVKKQAASGKEYPDEVPYFVIDPIEPIVDKRGNPVMDPETKKPMVNINRDAERLIAKFGAQPTEIPFVFASDDLDLIAETRRLWWKGAKSGAGSLVCSGDGEYAIYRGDQRVANILDMPVNSPPMYPIEEGYNRICNSKTCPQAQKQGDYPAMCKPTMTLRMMIPDVASTGFFSLQTSSPRAMSNCIQNLQMIKNSGGLRKYGLKSLIGVPMILNRIKASGHQGSWNFLVNVKIDEAQLEKEVLLLKNGQFSSFDLVKGPEHQILLESTRVDPDMDLIAQSQHGLPQTGDYVVDKSTGEILDNSQATDNCIPNVVDSAPNVVDSIPEGIEMVHEETPLIIRNQWLEADRELMAMFKELGNLKGVRVSPKKMELTLLKHESIEDAKTYLRSEIDKATPDIQQ